jgi:hypothetical protein
MQFDGEWPGIFLQGKDALRYAGAIQRLLGRLEDDRNPPPHEAVRDWVALRDLAEILDTCRAAHGEDDAKNDYIDR